MFCNICKTKIYDNCVKVRREKMEVYYCKLLILYIKWYNTT